MPLRALLVAVCFAAAAAGAQAQATGHQLFYGTAFAGTPPVSVPFAPTELLTTGVVLPVTVYLHRAADAVAAHPPALSFTIVWNPAVLTLPNPTTAVAAVPLLASWYDKQVTVNTSQAASGMLSISISGGVTFDPDDFEAYSTEITSFNNQLPLIAPESGATQQNPFPLVTVSFRVTGQQGASTPLSFDEVVMSDQDADPLPDQGAIDTVVTVGGGYPPAPPGTPAAGGPMLVLTAGAITWLAHARRLQTLPRR